eukprot:NODE_1057_length_1488_cov_63.869214_g1046_i0.p1 GENE.NODE_1057_length_1488_cov_63.869214_g1046_i0~~NODE_1057_length_1488_cov_63.869214_g1046_i0.p1  ORF type:complete len:487 (-),score=89.45 NODE_1057_length_1488_cov_63.869214_g1046_i0:28-1416(-)
MGYGDIGVFHDLVRTHMDRPHTPVLDAMARRGARLTQFYASSPVCTPSRASWLTGRHPAEMNIHTAFASPDKNLFYGQVDFLDSQHLTVGDVAQSAGYATAHFGKWHLGAVDAAPVPEWYGFNRTRTFNSNLKAPQIQSNVTWISREVVDETIDFIRAAEKKAVPAYVNAWFRVAHSPLMPPDDAYAEFPPRQTCRWTSHPVDLVHYPRCPTQVYQGAVWDMDRQIGRLVDYLTAMGLVDNTLLIFSADNGPETRHHYMHAEGTTGVFRGFKRSIYEGGVRMPSLLQWPARIPAKSIINHVLSSLDWLPTLAALIGGVVPSSHQSALSGVDVSALLAHPTASLYRQKALKWEYRFGIVGECWHGPPRVGLRRGDYKVYTNIDGPVGTARLEVYNITADPGELQNLALLGVGTDLVAELLEWQRTLPEPVRRGGSALKEYWHPGCAFKPIAGMMDQDHPLDNE